MSGRADNDTLLEIGKEGKEGDKNFKEYVSEKEKESKGKRDVVLEKIDKTNKQSKFTYNKFIAGLLVNRLPIIDWPLGWSYKVAPTQRGVVFEMEDNNGKCYRTAFKTTSDAVLDLNAIDNVVVRAENVIDRVSGSDTISVVKNGKII